MTSVHLAATLAMTGIIWFVQVVHYPLFSGVGSSSFAAYHTQHTRRTGWVVGPPMLVEAATGVWLVLRPAPDLTPAVAWAGLGLIAMLWIVTATVQVPAHRKLAAGYDEATWRALVAGNWIRTTAWTARSVLLLAAVTGPRG